MQIETDRWLSPYPRLRSWFRNGSIAAGILFFVHVMENGVYCSSNHNGEGGEVEPEHEDNDGPERAVSPVVVVEILKVDAKNAGEDQKKNDRDKRAGSDPVPAEAFEIGNDVEQDLACDQQDDYDRDPLDRYQ